MAYNNIIVDRILLILMALLNTIMTSHGSVKLIMTCIYEITLRVFKVADKIISYHTKLQ